MASWLPGRGGDGLDSAFLLRYARGIESRAGWIVVWYALVGALAGYGLGVMVVTLKEIYGQLQGGATIFAQLMGQVRPPVAEEFYWGYLPYLLAAVFAVIWGARGLGRSEEMRFRAQMALHVLKLQEMMLANNKD